MTTGTPRQAFMKPQGSADTGKAWMSFEESPVHGGGKTRQDERWTSFAETATHPSAMAIDSAVPLHLSSPAPYVGPSRLAVVPPVQNSGQSIRNPDMLNRTGTGPEMQTATQQPTLHHNTHPGHPSPQQPITVTHGPGSTISHILRHKSAETDHENSTEKANTTAQTAKHQGDVLIDTRDTRTVNPPHQKHSLVEGHQLGDPYYSSGGRASENVAHDPWFVTHEQSTYYKNQFGTMQSNPDGKIDGQTARNFFTKSRLPIPELSHIWELCDMDQDGHLTLLEFCAAFHLVVARKNGYELPAVLPKTLLPPLIKMGGISHQKVHANRSLIEVKLDASGSDKTPIAEHLTDGKLSAVQVMPKTSVPESTDREGAPAKQQTDNTQWKFHQDKWETFSDRTSSSTNLTNFDQSLDHTAGLVHPVALRITPSRHEAHSAKIRGEKPPPKSTDDDEHHPVGLTVPPSHKSLTNPYGSLKNDFSEPDSHTSTGPRVRSSSNSSHSSTGTSDRSLSEMDPKFKKTLRNPSDQEYQSDWSSRPLQPRSGSDSSIESASMDASVIAREGTNFAPTPPPRPNQPIRASKSDSFEADHSQKTDDVTDSAKVPTAAPTPPPRPQQSTTKVAEQCEEFADFSQFEKNKVDDTANKDSAPAPTEPVAAKQEEKQPAKPTPAPRFSREEKPTAKSSEGESKDEKSPEKGAHKKAPTKPPRSRIQSSESSVYEHSKIIKSNSITSPSDNIPTVAEKPDQEEERSKVSLQQSIRDLKLQNSKLTRLNADLQQELKDVMQSRITVEMSIHQLRPFSQ